MPMNWQQIKELTNEALPTVQLCQQQRSDWKASFEGGERAGNK